MSNYTQQRTEYITVTIGSGGTTTDIIDIKGKILVGIEMPATFTGTSLTILATNDNTNYKDYYNSAGSKVSISVGTNRYIGLLPADFSGLERFKLVSSATEGSARSLILKLRGM